jgi:hypothetical protein
VWGFPGFLSLLPPFCIPGPMRTDERGGREEWKREREKREKTREREVR